MPEGAAAEQLRLLSVALRPVVAVVPAGIDQVLPESSPGVDRRQKRLRLLLLVHTRLWLVAAVRVGRQDWEVRTAAHLLSTPSLLQVAVAVAHRTPLALPEVRVAVVAVQALRTVRGVRERPVRVMPEVSGLMVFSTIREAVVAERVRHRL